MTVKTERRGAGFFVADEVGGKNFTRKEIVVGQPVTPLVEVGTILGQKLITDADPVVSATTGTGDGAKTLDADPLGAGAKVGVYTFTCVTEKADVGVFEVKDPDGLVLPSALVGVLYEGPVRLTIADGAADWDIGDTFTVTVAADANQYYLPLSLTAVDGTAVPAGILFDEVDTTDAVQDGVLVAGLAGVGGVQVLGDELIYPTGATDNQKLAINADLLAVGIIVK